MTTGTELLLERSASGVATLTLNRPDKRNALSARLVAALSAALTQLAGDAGTRVVVLTGAGDAFCGGADIGEMRAAGTRGTEDNELDALNFAAMLDALESLPQPTLALVNGAAYGGALGLVTACDIALASDQARFALSEVRLGLVPAMISPYVVRAIGPRQASRWFLSGEVMGAATARQTGLVHDIAASDELAAHGARMVQALLAGGPRAQAEAKCLLRGLAGRSDAGDLAQRRQMAAWIARLRASPEGAEGLGAFLEKRRPAWLKDD